MFLSLKIEEYWSECQIWNDKLKDWDAYIEMAHEIKFYEDVFPLLHEFKSKVLELKVKWYILFIIKKKNHWPVVNIWQ